MPGSGINALWNESSPADVDNAGAGAGVIRSLETSLRNALAVEHNWPSATGANFGYHLLGSCRPYYAAQSLVSSSGTDARLMLTSDTSRLFGVGSGGTVLLGGLGMLSVDTIGTNVGVTMPQRAYWAIEFGQATSSTTGLVAVTFPNSGFSGAPFAWITAGGDPGTSYGIAVRILRTTATQLFADLRYADANVGTVGAAVSGVNSIWLSIGTRTL